MYPGNLHSVSLLKRDCVGCHACPIMHKANRVHRRHVDKWALHGRCVHSDLEHRPNLTLLVLNAPHIVKVVRRQGLCRLWRKPDCFVGAVGGSWSCCPCLLMEVDARQADTIKMAIPINGIFLDFLLNPLIFADRGS